MADDFPLLSSPPKYRLTPQVMLTPPAFFQYADPSQTKQEPEKLTLQMPSLLQPPPDPQSKYGLPKLIIVPVCLPKDETIHIVVTKSKPPDGYIKVPDGPAREFQKLADKAFSPAKPAGSPTPSSEPAKPAEGSGSPSVGIQFVAGVQGFYHLARGVKWDPRTKDYQELAPVLAVQVNVQFHDENRPGWELTASFQGSWDILYNDPQRPGSPTVIGPAGSAAQVQAQAQLSYSFPLIIDKLSAQALVQASVARGWNYDPDQKNWAGANQAGLAGGGGITWNITKKSSLGVQATVGPTWMEGGTRVTDTSIQIAYTYTF